MFVPVLRKHRLIDIVKYHEKREDRPNHIGPNHISQTIVRIFS